MTKDRLESLAILGGIAAFGESLHVGRPNIGDRLRLLALIGDMLDRQWLSNNGPYVQEFERRIAEIAEVKHCVAIANATIALEIMIRALELTGEVIVPSFTFVATAHALQWLGITPVFCDVDPNTHNLDPARVEELLTPRTTGIIGVHLWGRPCDVEALSAIAARHNLKLLFDAAHGFGCSNEGKMIGGFGVAEVFSFHATKFFNSFEGGAIVTNDDHLANRVRLMKNFGFAGYDNVVDVGTNGKMSEVSAAMGLVGLESLDEFIAINRRNYRNYQVELAGIPGISLLRFDEDEKCNYQYIVLEVDETVTRINRDKLLEVLWAENVLARRYFYPGCHRMEPYRSSVPNAGLRLPVTEKLSKRILVLPTGGSVSVEALQTLCSIVRVAVENGATLSKQLERSAAAEVAV
jgi:dTDP-4-amino-4,6-dideoxygalactose transaminase